MNNFRQEERAERSLGSRLQNHGATARDGGCNFVRDQVQRKIEWSDSSDGADGKSPDNTPAACGEFLQIERNVLPADAAGFFGGDREGENGTVDLSTRRLDGLASLERHSAGELLTAIGDRVRHL